jgi:hypothetical protein
MSRVYPTKGDDACTNKVSVPMSPKTKARLQRYAAGLRMSWTAAARQLIELGLTTAELPEEKPRC